MRTQYPSALTLGPRVIGQEAFERNQKMLEEQTDVLGPRVTDKHPSGEKAAPVVPKEPSALELLLARGYKELMSSIKELTNEGILAELTEDPRKTVSGAAQARLEQLRASQEERKQEPGEGLSVEDMAKALTNNPHLLETFIEAEFARPVVRKAALQAFIQAEQAKDEPNGRLVERLTQAMER